MTAEQQIRWDNWISNRPPIIQALALAYPPGEYLMKDGAPYGTSCPGQKVHLDVYFEDGTVSVIILAKEKTADCLVHENIMCAKYNKDPEAAHAANILVKIDPKWMKLIKAT